jgi:hypothetical protein
MLVSGSDTVIYENTVENITGAGIEVASGHYCNISFNEVANCSGYALDLASTVTNATVRQNIFFACGDGCQVIDDGDDNEFMYNHFSEWISPDADLDNVVDIPYLVDGEAENEDPYPLVDPDGAIPITTTTTTTTNTETGLAIPMEMVVIAGAGILIVVLVAVFVKRGR